MGARHGTAALKDAATRRWFRAAHVVFWVLAAIGTFLVVRHLNEFHAPSLQRGGSAARHRSPRSTGKVIAVIPMPNGAFEIAAGAGSIWVTTNSSSNPGAPGSETDIARINAGTNRVTVPFISTHDYAVDALGASSGAAVLSDQLQWLSAATNTTSAPILPEECGQPSFAENTSGEVWFVTSDRCGLLGRFNTLTGRLMNVEPSPTGGSSEIAVGDNQVWLANSTGPVAFLERVNIATGGRERIRRISPDALIAVGDGVVGVLAYSSIPPVLSRISDKTLAFLGSTPLIYEHAPNAALVEGDSRFWLSIPTAHANGIVAYSAQSGRSVGGAVLVGAEEFGTPRSMTFAFGSLWISGKNRVLRIEPNP
jgi:hypothetical protein